MLVPGAAVADGPPDFEVRLSAPALLEQSAPEGELVAALAGPGAGYAAALRDQTLTVRFFGTGEFDVNLAAGAIAARPVPGRGEVMIPVLLAGNVLALVLGLRGACVLHASAVELGGSSVAFAGGSGAGKSTAAALLCAAGGALVTDDAARVELGDGRFSVHRGPGELRLRPQARGLAERAGAARGITADERIAVEPRAASGVTSPLAAVVFPRWAEEAPTASAARLGPRAALDALLRCPRVIGWQAQAPIRSHFTHCAQIADAVPAFDLEIPRGRLDDPSLPEALRDALTAAGALGPEDGDAA